MFEWKKQYLTRSRREHEIHIFEPTFNVLFIIQTNTTEESTNLEQIVRELL